MVKLENVLERTRQVAVKGRICGRFKCSGKGVACIVRECSVRFYERCGRKIPECNLQLRKRQVLGSQKLYVPLNHESDSCRMNRKTYFRHRDRKTKTASMNRP